MKSLDLQSDFLFTALHYLRTKSAKHFSGNKWVRIETLGKPQRVKPMVYPGQPRTEATCGGFWRSSLFDMVSVYNGGIIYLLKIS